MYVSLGIDSWATSKRLSGMRNSLKRGDIGCNDREKENNETGNNGVGDEMAGNMETSCRSILKYICVESLNGICYRVL